MTLSSLVDHIKAYADAGYATFPTQEDKSPLPGCKWTEAKVDIEPNELKYPLGRFGVKLKDDDLIVDLDPRNMKDRKIWSELCDKVPGLKEIGEKVTVVRTGSRGLHVYLKKPPEFSIRKSLKEFPGMEFLSKGAYVVGAGSVGYEFLRPPFTAEDAPAGLLSLIKRDSVVSDMGELTHPGFSDSDMNVQRFTEYLLTLAPLAIEGEHGDETTYTVACRGRDFNLTARKTFELMTEHWNERCTPPWSKEELIRKVRNAYTYAGTTPGKFDPEVAFQQVAVELTGTQELQNQFDRFKSKLFKPSFRNAVLFLRTEVGVQGKFSLNEFTERIDIKGRVPWEGERNNRYMEVDDREVENIRLYLAQKYGGVEFSTQTIWKAVDLVGASNRHHPVREHIKKLKWDGVPRLDSWLVDYCGVKDKTLHRQMGRKVILAMVSRIFDPGCKFDYVLILEGKQGIGKSTLCNLLGGEWYGDAPLDPKDKDSIPYIHSHWVIELSELITVRKSEADRMKNFISRREDDVRLPYARARTKYPRQCIFIGTVNPDSTGYLTDTSGNRRYWCVWCNEIQYKEFAKVRDSLIAEAYLVWQKGERLTLPENLDMEARLQAAKREADDPWHGIICEWLAANTDINEATTQDIYRDVLGGSVRNMHTGHQRRIATCLQKLGWIKNASRYGNRYIRPVLHEGVL